MITLKNMISYSAATILLVVGFSTYAGKSCQYPLPNFGTAVSACATQACPYTGNSADYQCPNGATLTAQPGHTARVYPATPLRLYVDAGMWSELHVYCNSGTWQNTGENSYECQ